MTNLRRLHYSVLLFIPRSHALLSSPHNARYASRTHTPARSASTGTIRSLRLKTTLFDLPQLQEQTNTDQPEPPILARAFSRALRVAIRCGSLFGSIDGLSVRCEASSNRNVALGRISSLQVEFGRLSCALLKTRDFQLTGKDLELGFGPLLLLLVPFLFLWRKRVLPLMLCLVLGPRLFKSKKKTISAATYRLGLSGEDLSSRNTLLCWAVNRAMNHLLRNSVVGMLVESALAASKEQAAGIATDPKVMTPEEQMIKLAAALEQSSTQLELKKVSIGVRGRLVLDAVAIFPDGGNTSRLDFVVRMTLGPLDTQYLISSSEPKQALTKRLSYGCGIMVSNAEIKAAFNKDTMGMPLQIFGKPIPDLWIPVMSGGLALPFGGRHQVLSVESTPSQDRMDLCGAIYFGGDAPMQKPNAFGKWTVPFRITGSSGDAPSLQPPPPIRPSLPGN
jgi:hypothetical protein